MHQWQSGFGQWMASVMACLLVAEEMRNRRMCSCVFNALVASQSEYSRKLLILHLYMLNNGRTYNLVSVIVWIFARADASLCISTPTSTY